MAEEITLNNEKNSFWEKGEKSFAFLVIFFFSFMWLDITEDSHFMIEGKRLNIYHAIDKITLFIFPILKNIDFTFIYSTPIILSIYLMNLSLNYKYYKIKFLFYILLMLIFCLLIKSSILYYQNILSYEEIYSFVEIYICSFIPIISIILFFSGIQQVIRYISYQFNYQASKIISFFSHDIIILIVVQFLCLASWSIVVSAGNFKFISKGSYINLFFIFPSLLGLLLSFIFMFGLPILFIFYNYFFLLCKKKKDLFKVFYVLVVVSVIEVLILILSRGIEFYAFINTTFRLILIINLSMIFFIIVFNYFRLVFSKKSTT